MRPPSQNLGDQPPASGPVTSVESLLALLRTGPLLDAGQMAELTSMQGTCGEARDLARELLKRNWLTAFQVNQLFRGKASELLLGSYVLLEKLGEGGMGAVYKARNWKLNKIVALKLIRKQRLEDPNALRRFEREIRAAAQLDHPNIVRAFDADEVNGTHFLVMELVEGTDLGKVVSKHGPLPVEQACDCVRQVALGLQHAFERGMVHRDIKPANLLLVSAGLSRAGTVKILDMGLARVSSGEGEEESSSAVTQEGAVMGTPDYIAPEQALESHTVDIRADLYSLGCTFYFLLTGRVPFPGGNFLKKVNRHQFEVPPAIEELRPSVPPALADVVRKLMAKRPEERFQTPGELADALAHVPTEGPPTALLSTQIYRPQSAEATFANLRDEGEASTVPTKDLEGLPRGRWKVPAAIAGGVLLFVLLVVLLWPSGKKQQRPPSSPKEPKVTQAPRKQASPFFNGKDLTGWEGLDDYWKAGNGELVGATSVALKNHTYLCSKRTYRDFELAFRVKLSKGGNSGVQVRSAFIDRTAFTVKGPQGDMGVGFWGSLLGQNAGGMMKAAPRELMDRVIKEGDWNDYSIKVVGKHVTIKVNDEVPVDQGFPALPDEGIIAWQLAGGRVMQVTFKDIVFTDLSKARPGEGPAAELEDMPGQGPLFKFQGEYVGAIQGGGKLGAQVIALGDEACQAVVYPGGLPGAGWDGRNKILLSGTLDGEKASFEPATGARGYLAKGPDEFSATAPFPPVGQKNYKATIRAGVLTGKTEDGTAFELRKTIRRSPTLGARPPEGAIVLFDGTNTKEWVGGQLDGMTGLLSLDGSTIRTRRKFNNYLAHVEFLLPYLPKARGQGRGNSGFYQVDQYELQILDSFGLEGRHNECGGIYTRLAPTVNMCLPPLVWQTYDVEFTNAVRGEDGKKVKNARITLRHNGVVVLDNAEIKGVTGGAREEPEGTPGPLQLQWHGNAVQFRNIWALERK